MKLRNVSKVGQSTPARTTVKCDKCQFKSSMVQMKMHNKNIHMKKATRASKRVPAFTPDVKATKRAKPESIIQIVNLTNFDDSVLLSPDEPGTFDATNLDEMVIDSIQTEGILPPKNTDVPKQVSMKCCICEYEANDASHVKEHEINHHGMIK